MASTVKGQGHHRENQHRSAAQAKAISSMQQLCLWPDYYKSMDSLVVQMYGQCRSHLSTTSQRVIFQRGWQLPKSSTEEVFFKQQTNHPTFQFKESLINFQKRPKQSPPSIDSVTPSQRTGLTFQQPQTAFPETPATQQKKNPTLVYKTQRRREVGTCLPPDTDLSLGKWPIPSELKQSYLQIVHGENYPPLCFGEIAGWIFHTGYYLREQQIMTKLLDKEALKHSQLSQEIMAETVCTLLLFPA